MQHIRISGRRIVNAAPVVDVEEFPPDPEAPGSRRTLHVSFVGGRSLALEGEEAERFLRALWVYTPVEEE